MITPRSAASAEPILPRFTRFAPRASASRRSRCFRRRCRVRDRHARRLVRRAVPSHPRHGPRRSAARSGPLRSKFVDQDALLVLAESASADCPLGVRGNGHLRELVSLIGHATPHLRFERAAGDLPTCVRCGDWIGVYEPAVIVLDSACRLTSRAAEPDAVNKAPERYHRACYTDH